MRISENFFAFVSMVEKDHSRACRFRAFLLDFFLKFTEIFACKVHHRYQSHHAENFANGTTCVVHNGGKLAPVSTIPAANLPPVSMALMGYSGA